MTSSTKQHTTSTAAATADGTRREFYLPAMYQFSSKPGRLERFLARLIYDDGTVGDGAPATVVETPSIATATPGSPAANGRQGPRPRAP